MSASGNAKTRRAVDERLPVDDTPMQAHRAARKEATA
jgi:hypothetical protein